MIKSKGKSQCKIILVMAITLDGKIAKHKSHLADWTSKEDKIHFVKITKKVGVVIMGMNTFKLFSKPLKGRLNIVISNKYKKPQKDVIFYNDMIWNIKDWLSKKGIKQAILCGGSFTNRLFLESLMIDELYITIEPRIFGEGLCLFGGNFNRNLKLLSIKKLNSDSILLHYKILK